MVVAPRQPVEVVLPRWAPAADAGRILAELEPWIRSKVSWARSVQARADTLGLSRPGLVWIAGEPIPIAAGAPAGRPRAAISKDRSRLLVTGPSEDATDAILRWYRREARTRIGVRVAQEARRIGVQAGPVSIRDPRSLWASCSPSGSLSFSWRLAMAPPAVLGYVVVHELCHRRRPDHSRRFWAMVERVCPDWRSHRRWLDDVGWQLREHRPRPL